MAFRYLFTQIGRGLAIAHGAHVELMLFCLEDLAARLTHPVARHESRHRVNSVEIASRSPLPLISLLQLKVNAHAWRCLRFPRRAPSLGSFFFR